jgi:hypothetical protein
MPTNLLATDTMYPDLTKGTTDEKIQQIGNYLYMLREQLRYTLGNLGENNFNETELENIGNIITEPIYLQIYGTEGNAVIQFTEKGLYGRIEDAENNVAQVSVNTQALMSRMSNAEGNISTLAQTANFLSSRITSLNGSVSSLTQTVNGFSLSVSNGSTSSTIKLMSGSTEISSQTISFSGTVTFSDLKNSSTVISGSCITTGTIDADEVRIKNLRVGELYGNSIYIYDDDYDEGALLQITGASSYDGGKLGIVTGAFSVEAMDGDIYLDNADGMYLQIESGGEFIFGNGDMRPNYDDSYTCGTSSRAWTDIYSCNDLNVTSDLTKKKDVKYGLSAYDGLFDSLRPISFLFTHGTSGRRHIGLGAQDVEEALAANGLSSLDFAGLVKSPKVDDEGEAVDGFDYHLRYGEFIALLIEQVQTLKKRVAALEGKA